MCYLGYIWYALALCVAFPSPPKVWNNLHVVAPQHAIMLCSVAQLLQLHHSFRFLDVNIWSVEFHVQLTSIAITLFTDARMGRRMLLKLIYIVTINIWSIEFHMQFTIIAMGPLLTYARLGKGVLSRLICIVAELVQGINVHGLCLQYAAGEQISLWMGQMPHRSPKLPWIDGRRDWKYFPWLALWYAWCCIDWHGCQIPCWH